jgi:hypothetical protein
MIDILSVTEPTKREETSFKRAKELCSLVLGLFLNEGVRKKTRGARCQGRQALFYESVERSGLERLAAFFCEQDR